MTKTEKALLELLESGEVYTKRSAANALGKKDPVIGLALESLVMTDVVKYVSHYKFMLNPRLLRKKRSSPGTFSVLDAVGKV